MKQNSCITRPFFVFLFVLTIALGSFGTQAQVFSSPGGDIVIPDGPNAPQCTNPGAYVCKDVVVSGLPGFAVLRGAAVVLIDHENVGSIDLEVRGPGGTPTFMPFSRTGSTSPTDCGDTSDVEGDYTFQDNAIGNWWATAAALGVSQIMPSGTYFTSFPGGGPAPPAGTSNGTMSQTFLGTTNGTWQVCVRDWGDNGGGRLQLARLDFIVPTAATSSVSGQVLTAGGRGISNATVTITGGTLPEPLTTRTGTFGYYSFAGLPTGETYILTVNAKRFSFSNPTQILNVQDDIAEANFVAEEK